MLVLDLAPLLKAQGAPVPFRFKETWHPLDTGQERIELTAPVELEGICWTSGGVFVVQGTRAAAYTARCSRCLRPVPARMHVEVEEEFARQESEDNPDRYLISGTAIDLTQMVEDTILLHLPMRHLCNINCKGLCPVCGADRNITQCSCGRAEDPAPPEGTQRPFEMLKTLLRDDEEEV